MARLLTLVKATSSPQEEEWEKALHEFNITHEGKPISNECSLLPSSLPKPPSFILSASNMIGEKALAQVYGEASKRLLVHALYTRLHQGVQSPTSSSSSSSSYRIQAEALLALRTCLRERIAIEELLTPQVFTYLPTYLSTHLPMSTSLCVSTGHERSVLPSRFF